MLLLFFCLKPESLEAESKMGALASVVSWGNALETDLQGEGKRRKRLGKGKVVMSTEIQSQPDPTGNPGW